MNLSHFESLACSRQFEFSITVSGNESHARVHDLRGFDNIRTRMHVIIPIFLSFFVVMCGCSTQIKSNEQGKQSNSKVSIPSHKENVENKSDKKPAQLKKREIKDAKAAFDNLMSAMRNRDIALMKKLTTKRGYLALMAIPFGKTEAKRLDKLEEMARQTGVAIRLPAKLTENKFIVSRGPEIKEQELVFVFSPSGWKLDGWFFSE
jgi:hypothetical protein